MINQLKFKIILFFISFLYSNLSFATNPIYQDIINNNKEPVKIEAEENKQYYIITFNLNDKIWLYEKHLKVKINNVYIPLFDVKNLMISTTSKKVNDEFYGQVFVYIKNVSFYIPKSNFNKKPNLVIQYIACDFVNGVCFPPKNKELIF